MQSDRSSGQEGATSDTERVPDGARAAMRNLALDQETVRVVTALEERGVRVILLKGPSVARWLYRPGERSYVDIDLLLRPGDEKVASGVLEALGYSTQAGPVLGLDRPSYQEWTRDGFGGAIDLHPTLNLLEQLPPELVWDVMGSEAGELALATGRVTVLNEGARALHVALHALAHDAGSTSEQAESDLRRAIESLDLGVWAEAVRVSQRLGAGDLLAQALLIVPEGAGLAHRLGLEAGPVAALEARLLTGNNSEQAATLGVGWWLSLSAGDKVRLLIQKMFPSKEYLEARSALARRGGVWLVVAYAARPFIILGWGIRGAVGWTKARRVTR